MSLRSIAALSFVNELEKIGSDLELPLNGVTVKEAEAVIKDSFLEPLLKVALTRSVKEYRLASGLDPRTGAASGQQGLFADPRVNPVHAEAIAQAAVQNNNRTRFTRDISIGGAEAGVDQHIGSAHASLSTPAGQRIPRVPGPSGNKPGQLTLPGTGAPAPPAAPAAPLMEGPEESYRGVSTRTMTPERMDLLKRVDQRKAGTLTAPAPTANPNAGQLAADDPRLAVKNYKPDSFITQGAHTPRYLDQKMRMTEAARGLSEDAKQMVPAMYGHATSNVGTPVQRSRSYHEFVPGMREMDDHNAQSTIDSANRTVLQPLQTQKKMTMDDVAGTRTANFGNLVHSPAGPKIVDFKPLIKGETDHSSASFMEHGPGPVLRHSEAGGGTNADLRREQYNPARNARGEALMQSLPVSDERVHRAIQEHRIAAGKPAEHVDPSAQSAPPAKGGTEPGFKTVHQGPLGASPDSIKTVGPQPRTIPQAPISAAFHPQAGPPAISQAPTKPVVPGRLGSPAVHAPSPLPTVPTFKKPVRLPSLGGLAR